MHAIMLALSTYADKRWSDDADTANGLRLELRNRLQQDQAEDEQSSRLLYWCLLGRRCNRITP